MKFDIPLAYTLIHVNNYIRDLFTYSFVIIKKGEIVKTLDSL